MTPEFKVRDGLKAFEVIDSFGVVYASSPDEESAEDFCERLNLKWEGFVKEDL